MISPLLSNNIQAHDMYISLAKVLVLVSNLWLFISVPSYSCLTQVSYNAKIIEIVCSFNILNYFCLYGVVLNFF